MHIVTSALLQFNGPFPGNHVAQEMWIRDGMRNMTLSDCDEVISSGDVNLDYTYCQLLDITTGRLI